MPGSALNQKKKTKTENNAFIIITTFYNLCILLKTQIVQTVKTPSSLSI